jgi:hypothetical protein
MVLSFLEQFLVERALGAISATANGPTLDLAGGAHAITAVAVLGTVAAGGSVVLRFQESDDGATWVNAADASATATDAAASTKPVLVCYPMPRRRFVRARVEISGTAAIESVTTYTEPPGLPVSTAGYAAAAIVR